MSPKYARIHKLAVGVLFGAGWCGAAPAFDAPATRTPAEAPKPAAVTRPAVEPGRVVDGAEEFKPAKGAAPRVT